MKNNYVFKSWLNLFFLIVGFSLTLAQAVGDTFLVNGVNYKITSTAPATVGIVPVSTSVYDKYKGDITIPKTVDYRLNTYTVTSVEEKAFDRCVDLNSITFADDGVTQIKNFAFSGCSNLSSVTLPKGLQYIGQQAFASAKFTSIVLPDSLLDIGSGAFTQSGLTSIVIPNNIKVIKDNTFSNCSALESITFPETIEEIRFYAFGYCSSLSKINPSVDNNVNFPESLIKMEYSSFTNTALVSVKIPSKINVIEDGVFENCSYLVEAKLHEGITSIGSAAFAGTALPSVAFPSTVQDIGYMAYYNCQSLDSIALPEGLISIGGYAFSSTALPNVSIPSTVTTIGDGAFSYCSNFNNIVFINSTAPLTLGREAFMECSLLVAIDIPERTTFIGSGAFQSTGLKSIIIPSKITSIEDYTFKYCADLASITLPEGIVSIGEAAFSDSGLLAIELPAGVNNILDYAFYNCNKLTSFTCKALTLPTLQGTYTFSGDTLWQGNCDLIVPDVSLTDYKAADQWKEFRFNTNTLSVQNEIKSKSILYPNPAKEYTTIFNIAKGSSVNVYDITGKLLFSTITTDAKITLDTSNYKNGIYLVKVNGQTIKLLVTK